MKFIKSIAAVMQLAAFLIFGGLLVTLSLNVIPTSDILDTVSYLYADPNMKMILGAVGALLLIIGLVSANVSLGRIQSEKTIAFENPEGQVTVSLSAIEDYVKKSVRHLPEVKELRSKVTASKRGINIVCRATIFAESNIPQITERIQGIVKSRVHDMLGVEESINIKIHVTKISSKSKGEGSSGHSEYEDTSRRMPFGE